MKNETMGVVITPNKKEQKESMESKETNSADMKADGHQRHFGALDMWYLQKRQRTAASMLRRLQ
ncbi:MAG TPA: hypothetical protein PLZ45_16925 [Ferruginibacter sp.]|nr:hypothetical protein [Ferruginibacter sp.]